ncbi:hypothetical protein RXP12_29015, partial [Pseudomonas aeruginosa]|nr:hypothetical protein [Pseudomonas aeruginosa]
AQRMAGYDENDERPAWPHVISFRVVTPYEEHAPETPAKPAKRDLRTIEEPFGELDERTQNRLRKASKRGWPVQCLNPYIKAWDICSEPSFWPFAAYRLDPTFTPPAKHATFWLTNGRAYFNPPVRQKQHIRVVIRCA